MDHHVLENPQDKKHRRASPNPSKKGSHHSLDLEKQIAKSPRKLKKRVTIQSEATILILRETGLARVVTDSPYYTQGCRDNVKWAAYFDIILSIIEAALCVVTVAYAIIISEEGNFIHSDTYSTRDIFHGITGLGVTLILCYFTEIWLVRRLLSEITLPEIDRHDAVRPARHWRWSNMILMVFELFFGVLSSVGGNETLAGCGLLLGPVLRVVGICIVHQFIQELETVTVTPFSNDSTENSSLYNADDRVSVTSDTNIGDRDPRPVASSMSLPVVQKYEQLDKLQSIQDTKMSI